MKKSRLFLLILLVVLVPKVCQAKQLDYDYYKRLNVKYAFIVGDYMFNMDNGYSPSLEDIMIASRTIKEGNPTTLYEIRMFPAWNYFSVSEIYKNTSSNDKNILENMNVRYIYRNNIKKANSKEFDTLS